ncbi:MAG TPA: class I SAM-dependent methyltransferase [Gaiellaceae bacterium]|nr:class I SAM-dependent methyltransferase [Gaiellaceae bacterium]
MPWREARSSDAQLAGRDRYPLLRCRDCHSAWIVPEERPSDAARLYAEGTYAQPLANVARALRPLRAVADAERLSFLRGVPSGARILELGSGDGRFVEGLRRRGFDVHGTDPFPRGGGVGVVSAEAIEAEPGTYDVVIAWHVLEHLDDPEESLRRARRALIAGGRIVVATPNLGSFQARLGGDRWFHQDVPRHTVLFTAVGLEALLRRCGFGSVRICHFGVQQNLLGMWQTIVNRLTREQDVPFRAVKRMGRRSRSDVARAAVGGVVALPVATPSRP